MPKTFILIDATGAATVTSEKDIERVAAERMVAGEAFQVFKAEPMRLQLTLSPATEPARAISAPTPKVAKKKGRRKKAGRRKVAKRGAKTGRVGRPPVNVGPCTVAGCNRRSKTRGLCSAHYQQHRRLVREKKPGLIKKAGTAGATPEAGKSSKAAVRGKTTRRKGAGRTATAAMRKTGRKTSQARSKKS